MGKIFFLPESLPLYLFLLLLLLHFPAFFFLLLLSETEVEELITDRGSKGKRRRKEETPTQKRQKKKKDFCPFCSGASARSSQGEKGGRVNGGEDERGGGEASFSHEGEEREFIYIFCLSPSRRFQFGEKRSLAVHSHNFLKNISHISPSFAP